MANPFSSFQVLDRSEDWKSQQTFVFGVNRVLSMDNLVWREARRRPGTIRVEPFDDEDNYSYWEYIVIDELLLPIDSRLESMDTGEDAEECDCGFFDEVDALVVPVVVIDVRSYITDHIFSEYYLNPNYNYREVRDYHLELDGMGCFAYGEARMFWQYEGEPHRRVLVKLWRAVTL
jgi:hypothetical protein